MKLASAQRKTNIEAQIKAAFAQFNRSIPPSKGRRYPVELQILVRQALVEGLKLSDLSRLTGTSVSVMRRWIKSGNSDLKQASDKNAQPRRLEVVGADFRKPQDLTVVRLPSGVSIELPGQASLSRDFLTALAALEVTHASSR